jgi:DNA-binding MarR family transcriptional regulator
LTKSLGPAYVISMRQHAEMPDEQPWTVERLQVLIGDVVAAALRGDVSSLTDAASECRETALRLRKMTPMPMDPWMENAVAYGSLLGLAETAEIAARTVVAPEVLRYLVESTEARRVLLRLAAEPGGLISQARIPAVTGIHRANAHPTLARLEEYQLIDRATADANGTARTLELTNGGRAAVEMLRAWGLADTSEEAPSVKQLLRARASIKTVAERLTTSPENGRQVGRIFVAASAKERALLCKAASRRLRALEPGETVRFVVAMVEAMNEEKREPIGRAAGRLLSKIKGKSAAVSLETICEAWTRDPWPTECRPMAEAVQHVVER